MSTKCKNCPHCNPKIKWFARGGHILKSQPFNSQIEAVNSMRMVGPDHAPEVDRFPPDVFVWPEIVE